MLIFRGCRLKEHPIAVTASALHEDEREKRIKEEWEKLMLVYRSTVTSSFSRAAIVTFLLVNRAWRSIEWRPSMEPGFSCKQSGIFCHELITDIESDWTSCNLGSIKSFADRERCSRNKWDNKIQMRRIRINNVKFILSSLRNRVFEFQWTERH